MRVCSKCGYHDSPYWHSYRWVNDMDIARWEDFIKDYPQFGDLKHGEIRSDEYHYYRRSNFRRGRGLRVQRWSKDLGKYYYNMRDFEPHDKNQVWLRLPSQTKLLEASK